MNEIKKKLIAPCGMNCALCIAYQFKENDLNKKGFHKKYCPGCLPRDKNCTHMGDKCELLGKGKVRYCYECKVYPCKMLKNLDKRYRTKYYMSMIENLNCIKADGLDTFLDSEAIKWKCPKCGETICCHNGLCLQCNVDILLWDRKYRWNNEA